ncbi:TldD/PmbA family protein, partial [Streptomyces sp. NPDC059374]
MSARTHKPHEIVERALELSRADGCVVIADEQSTANLRWAGNALTTNGVTRGRTLTVVATVDGKEGTASGVVSRAAVTVDELEPLVRAAEAAARAAGPAEDAQPLVTDVPASPDFTDAPAETSSTVFADFAPALGEAWARAPAGGRGRDGGAQHPPRWTVTGAATPR